MRPIWIKSEHYEARVKRWWCPRDWRGAYLSLGRVEGAHPNVNFDFPGALKRWMETGEHWSGMTVNPEWVRPR